MPDRAIEPIAFSPQAAADALQVSRMTVYNWLNAGILPSVKIGRTRRIPASAIVALMEQAR